MNSVRVMLADDHSLFRAGLRALLENVPDFNVVAEASTGREALQVIPTSRPDVLLMDIWMPELNGLDATARVSAKFPQVKTIILSINAAEEYVHQALRAGAAGYLLKNASPEELKTGIKAVARGDVFLSSALALSAGDVKRRIDLGHQQALSQLTVRKREVLQLVAEGYKTKEIAKKLNLSVKTIEMHRTQIMSALGIHDIPGLVRYAIRSGLISPDS